MSDHHFPKRADIHRARTLRDESSRNSATSPQVTPSYSQQGRFQSRAETTRARQSAESRNRTGVTKFGNVVRRQSPDPSDKRAIYEHAMNRALFLANRAREGGDVPVGAVVIDEFGTILGEGWNTREASADPTGHAEIMALQEAAKKKGTWRLDDLTLVVTLEPCTMCAGAVVNSRLKRLVIGAWDPKAGAAGSIRDVVRDARLNHQVEVVPNVLKTECEIQLRGFFSARRNM
jgi:tRNA(adenine34) deaminase